MIALWCVLIMSLLIAVIITIGYRILCKEMRSIGDSIMYNFEEDIENDGEGIVYYNTDAGKVNCEA